MPSPSCLENGAKGSSAAPEQKQISKAKANTLAARREIMRVVYTQAAVKKLMEVIAPRYSERAGGFTRIIKTGNRKGDNAEKSVIELV